MNCLFVQIRCRPGTAYTVATQIVLLEIHSEPYSISGDYDLLMKLENAGGILHHVAAGLSGCR